MKVNKTEHLIAQTKAGAFDWIVWYHVNCKSYKQRDALCKEGSYPFVPNTYGNLVPTLKRAYDMNQQLHEPPTFLDVGCGIGNVMLLASVIGFKAYGIEKYKLSTVGSFGFGNTIMADALTYQEYSKYDVIYYYCPLYDHDTETELENKIENECKVGSLLLPFYKRDGKIRTDKRFEMITMNIWRKVKA